jgi:hypothetical protein
MARLDRLSLGAECPVGAARLVASFPELLCGLPRIRTLAGSPAELVASELLFCRGVATAVYRFGHALIQDAAYSTLIRDQRKELHSKIATALERFSETSAQQPEILAHHYAEAGLAEPAIEYWFKAGKRDLTRSAYVEAVKHLSQAIEFTEQMPDSRERSRKELDLHLALGPAIIAVKGLASVETMRVYSRARELLGEGGAVAEQMTIHAGLWAVHHGRVEHLQARDVAQGCLAFATRGPRRRVGAGQQALRTDLLHDGCIAAARQHLQQTVVLCSGMASGLV